MKKYSAFMAGILGLMLVFGFALMSCKTDDDGGTEDNPFVGTWSGDGGTIIVTDSGWEWKENSKGTYARDGSTATLTVTHSWDEDAEEWVGFDGEAKASATVSGETLTITFGDNSLKLTKESNAGDDSGSSSNPFVGTWSGDGGTVIVTDSKWTWEENLKGTYARDGSKATLTQTHKWNKSTSEWVENEGDLRTATVSGKTLTVQLNDGSSLEFTKESNAGDDSGSSSNPFVGTWSASGSTLTITNSEWTWKEYIKGTYARDGSTATLTVTHSWDEDTEEWVGSNGAVVEVSATVSGKTLTITLNDGSSLAFTKD
ncbi:MAG: hypothetical protein LBU25_07980 [Treponema sp.]|nr:hypothetical protein [Treponema sp.]